MAVWITDRRAQAAAILQAAAGASGNPLFGCKVLIGRHAPLKAKDLPAIVIYSAAFRRQAVDGKHMPSFAAVWSLSVEFGAKVLAASSTAASTSLDLRLEAMADAIDLALLESPDFVKQFTAVQGADTEFFGGKDGEFYWSGGLTTFDFAVGQDFEGPAGSPFTQVQVRTVVAPVVGADPPENHELESRFQIPES